jgi:predicted ABC-type ATPase
MAIARVAERVCLGGHNVPEATIRRRYHSGLANFFALYRTLADYWYLFDNSAPGCPALIASSYRETGIVMENGVVWNTIEGEAYDCTTA